MRFFARRPKVFCIGRNKTGTTSIGRALTSLGFKVASQAEAELMIEDWAWRDFCRIISFCRTANAFQDVPFSLDFTYQAIDHALPGSKFVLTIRESSEIWYSSLLRFHTKIVGKGRTPTVEDLKEFGYRYRGWLWRQHQLVYGIDESTLYDRRIYTHHYERHNARIEDYFRYRSHDLLVLHIGDPLAMKKLCEFLDIGYDGQLMPHLNSSA